MVATPFKKTKNESKTSFKSYVDAVVSAENMWWHTQQFVGKKDLTGNEPTLRNPVAGQKEHFTHTIEVQTLNYKYIKI